MTAPVTRPPAPRVPVERLRVHQRIVDHLGLVPGDVLLDLGCGTGFTMATAASRTAGLTMVGVDLDGDAVASATSWLAATDARCGWALSDIGAPLPLRDASFTHTVCHDVLEYLEDPVHLLAEASRVLRPGGVAVWSHTDYDALVIGGADRMLTRRIVSAYADVSYQGLERSDAQMGRKLAAVVDRSPLQRTGIDAAVLITTSLAGPGRFRVDDIAATVAGHGGATGAGPGDVEDWVAQLAAADRRGDFFYSQIAYVVITTNPPSPRAASAPTHGSDAGSRASTER